MDFSQEMPSTVIFLPGKTPWLQNSFFTSWGVKHVKLGIFVCISGSMIQFPKTMII